MIGNNINKPVEIVEIEKEVIREVCPVLQSANYTIITGNVMKEKVIILEGK